MFMAETMMIDRIDQRMRIGESVTMLEWDWSDSNGVSTCSFGTIARYKLVCIAS